MGIKKQLTKIFTEVWDKEKALTGTLYIKEKACNRRPLFNFQMCIYDSIDVNIEVG